MDEVTLKSTATHQSREFSVSFDVLGCKLAVHSSSPAFGAEVGRLMRSFPRWGGNGSGAGHELSFAVSSTPVASGRRTQAVYQIQCNQKTVGSGTEMWQLMGCLEQQLRLYLSQIAIGRLLLRGSAVAGNGRAVLWLGQPGSGKSSMALALLRQGFQYYTDELVAIDPRTGWVTSVPTPLSLSTPGLFPQVPPAAWLGPTKRANRRKQSSDCTKTSRWYLHPDDVRANSVAIGPVPIRTIFFPTYVPRAKPEFEPLTSGQALRRLCDTVLNGDAFGGDVVMLAAKLVRNARCFSVVVNGPEATLEAIDQLLNH